MKIHHPWKERIRKWIVVHRGILWLVIVIGALGLFLGFLELKHVVSAAFVEHCFARTLGKEKES